MWTQGGRGSDDLAARGDDGGHHDSNPQPHQEPIIIVLIQKKELLQKFTIFNSFYSWRLIEELTTVSFQTWMSESSSGAEMIWVESNNEDQWILTIQRRSRSSLNLDLSSGHWTKVSTGGSGTKGCSELFTSRDHIPVTMISTLMIIFCSQCFQRPCGHWWSLLWVTWRWPLAALIPEEEEEPPALLTEGDAIPDTRQSIRVVSSEIRRTLPLVAIQTGEKTKL